MKTITIVNSKGGVGKSTLTANLISQSIMMNFKILYLDLDKQKSLSNWADKYKYKINKFDGKNLIKKEIKKYKKFSFFFIDSPASIRSKTLDSIVNVSDVIVIPISASSIDIKASKNFILRIKRYKKIRKIKILLVLNKIRYSKDNNIIIKDYEKILRENFIAWIPQTKSFDDQMSRGKSINDSKYPQKQFITDQLIKIINNF